MKSHADRRWTALPRIAGDMAWMRACSRWLTCKMFRWVKKDRSSMRKSRGMFFDLRKLLRWSIVCWCSAFSSEMDVRMEQALPMM